MVTVAKALRSMGAQMFAKSHFDEVHPDLKSETRRNTRGNRSRHTPAALVYASRQSSSSSLYSTASVNSEDSVLLLARVNGEKTNALESSTSVRRIQSEGDARTPQLEYQQHRAKSLSKRGHSGEDSVLRKVVSFSSLADVVDERAEKHGEAEVRFAPRKNSKTSRLKSRD